MTVLNKSIVSELRYGPSELLRGPPYTHALNLEGVHGRERLVYEYRPVCQLENHDIIDNGIVPSICIYIPPPQGCALMRSCTVSASLGRERTLNMHGGVCPTFMYMHLYYHALVFPYCFGPLRTSSWLCGAGMQVLSSKHAIKE